MELGTVPLMVMAAAPLLVSLLCAVLVGFLLLFLATCCHSAAGRRCMGQQSAPSTTALGQGVSLAAVCLRTGTLASFAACVPHILGRR